MGMTITEIKPEQIFLGENKFMVLPLDAEFDGSKKGALCYLSTDPATITTSVTMVETIADVTADAALFVYAGEDIVTALGDTNLPVCVGGKVDFSKLSIFTGDINALTAAQKLLIKSKLTQSGIHAIDVNDQTVYDNQ